MAPKVRPEHPEGSGRRAQRRPNAVVAGQGNSNGQIITSKDNRWIKLFRGALRGSSASPAGPMGLEGPHLVEEALRSGLDVEAILVSSAGERHMEKIAPLLAACSPNQPAGLRPLRTSDKIFSSIAATQAPQGIAALVRPRTTRFEDLIRGLALVVVLVEVQDPGNVGTIIRSAEAFGATGVVTTRGTAQPWSPKVIRASAGSVLRLPILPGMATAIVLTQLRVAGLALIAAATAAVHAGDMAAAAGTVEDAAVSSFGAVLPAQCNLRAPAALLIGNEGAGLPPAVARAADVCVRIPVEPDVESLNAAVAASVLLYEAARQRNVPPAGKDGGAADIAT